MNRTILFLTDSAERPKVGDVVRALQTINADRLGVMLHRSLWFRDAARDDYGALLLRSVKADFPRLWRGLHYAIERDHARGPRASLGEQAEVAAALEAEAGPMHIAYADNAELLWRGTNPGGPQLYPFQYWTDLATHYVRTLWAKHESAKILGCSAPFYAGATVTEYGVRDQGPGETALGFAAARASALRQAMRDWLPAWSTLRRTIGWVRMPRSFGDVHDVYALFDSAGHRKLALTWHLPIERLADEATVRWLSLCERLLLEWDRES